MQMAKLTKSQVYKRLSEVQAKASLRVQKAFEESDRTKVIMACGTGKTYVGADVISKLDCNVSVVVVPSLQLVQQWITRFTGDRRLKRYSILPVCSQDGVDSPEDYDIQNSTTDKATILRTCKKNQPVIVVVTYHSFPDFADAVRGKVRVHFLVADEAHRTAGVKAKHFASCLDDKILKVSKRLFMTATPVVYRGDSSTVYCMNDSDSYGSTAFSYPYAEARDDGVLSPMRVKIFGVATGDTAHLLNTMREHRQQAMLAEALANLKLRPRQKTRMLVFHNSVAASKAFCEKLRSLGIWAEHLNGHDSVKKRLDVIDRFSNHKGPSVICSVRVFSEGVDAPEIDTIVFAERKSSPVDINQSTGRGTRWTERKNHLTIMIPYYTELALTQKEMRESLIASKYGPLMEVIAAISSIDDAMSEYRIAPAEVSHDAGDGVVEIDDAENHPVAIVKDAPAAIETDGSSRVAYDFGEKAAMVEKVALVKRLPVEVSILTNNGEFDAGNVREVYLRNLAITWPIEFYEMCKIVLERFGAMRPNTSSDMYYRLKDVCGLAIRNYTLRQVLDFVYGNDKAEERLELASIASELLIQIVESVLDYHATNSEFPSEHTAGKTGMDHLKSWSLVNRAIRKTEFVSLLLLSRHLGLYYLYDAICDFRDNNRGRFPRNGSGGKLLMSCFPSWNSAHLFLKSHSPYKSLSNYCHQMFGVIDTPISRTGEYKVRAVKCDVCKREFQSRHRSEKNGRFCSKKCRTESKKRHCKHCGVIYLPRTRGSEQQFCSVRCSNRYNRSRINTPIIAMEELQKAST